MSTQRTTQPAAAESLVHWAFRAGIHVARHEGPEAVEALRTKWTEAEATYRRDAVTWRESGDAAFAEELEAVATDYRVALEAL